MEVELKVLLGFTSGEFWFIFGKMFENAVRLMVLADLVSTLASVATSEVSAVVVGPGGGNSSKSSKGKQFHFCVVYFINYNLVNYSCLNIII